MHRQPCPSLAIISPFSQQHSGVISGNHPEIQISSKPKLSSSHAPANFSRTSIFLMATAAHLSLPRAEILATSPDVAGSTRCLCRRCRSLHHRPASSPSPSPQHRRCRLPPHTTQPVAFALTSSSGTRPLIKMIQNSREK
ncbi:uncharacterized protein LOC131143461 isoform X2 [Malania oleifera]|uniref:uncharacterized protein LOC131143461 isoform X2 n=1 Tax=Malania oleifera TaxID=397392 RepID=UPI0025AE23A6|nr:uncharacterized protein LOC131143461 isoform X2 [Malania oleifera]